MNDFDISGKTMVITGATSGIGRGLVDHFIDRGVVVAAVGGHEATAEQLRDELAATNRSARTYAADLRDVASTVHSSTGSPPTSATSTSLSIMQGWGSRFPPST